MGWWLLGALMIGIVAGYALCAFATWQRVHHQESDVRGLIVGIRTMMDMDDEVPPEWVISQLETMVAKDFR